MNERKFINKASIISPVLLLILSSMYFVFMRFNIPLFFYMDNYHKIAQVGGYILLAGYLFTMAIVVLVYRSKSSKLRSLSVGFFFLATVFCCPSADISLNLPKVIDKIALGNVTYHLTSEIERFDVHVFHYLYKCENTNIQCEKTSFWEGGGASSRPLSLMIDDSSGNIEINVVYTFGDGSQQLIYTYGNPDRDYEGEPIQFRDHLYYLAYYRNSESSTKTYTLYQCQLDNKGCTHLQVEYQGSGRYSDLQLDETSNEIKFFFYSDFDAVKVEYVDEILIFSYGETPRCYVEGCKILEPLE